MIHQILITEGLDRCGKGTALKQLEHNARKNGFEVVTLFKPTETNEKYNELSAKSYEPLALAKKAFSNHLNYDLFSLGSLELVRTALIGYHLSEKNYIILIDRFAISNMIYGEVLRKKEFTATFPDKSILFNYICGALLSLTTFANVDLYVAVRPVTWFDYQDDLENENISITSTQLSAINSKFAEFIRSNEFTKFYCEATTKINVCLLNIQYQKPIEFYDKIIQNQQCLDIPYLLP